MRHSGASRSCGRTRSALEGGNGTDRFRLPQRCYRAGVLPARGPASAGPSGPRQRLASASERAAICPSVAKPRAASRRADTGPIPGRSEIGFPASQACPSAAFITKKPRGLSRSAARLGQQPVGGEADRHRHPHLPLHRQGKAGKRHGGRGTVDGLGAGEVEDRLIDRQRAPPARSGLSIRARRWRAAASVISPSAGGSPPPRGRRPGRGTSAWRCAPRPRGPDSKPRPPPRAGRRRR